MKFLLLKGAYEERISHTVMQRDQWFQVLMGSKKRALGAIPENGEGEVQQDRITSASVDRAKPAICGHFKTGQFQ